MNAAQEKTYGVLRNMGYEYDRTEGETVIVKRWDRSCDAAQVLDEKRIYASGNTVEEIWPAWDDELGYPHASPKVSLREIQLRREFGDDPNFDDDKERVE